MNLNMTLIGQMITFALFVAFTMRFVWPNLIVALEARQAKIADGLAAAERGHKELELAQESAVDRIRQTKEQAAIIIEQANRRGGQIIEEAKDKAVIEAKRVIAQAQSEIVRQMNQAKQDLRQQVATIAIAGAEKLIGRNIDRAANNELVEQMIEEL